jgi:hypothetical protein
VTHEKRVTDAEVIALAAARLYSKGNREFSEWDLTVEAWKFDKNRFGCRGYESDYPDHKRVMMAMARSKPVIRDGWISRLRTNCYFITPLGLAAAQRLASKGRAAVTTKRSPGPTYSALLPYVSSSLFAKYGEQSLDQISWYDAEAFLGIAEYSKVHLEKRLNLLHKTVQEARSWFEAVGAEDMRSGSSGGAVSLSRADVERLVEILDYIQQRFAEQFTAIMEIDAAQTQRGA